MLIDVNIHLTGPSAWSGKSIMKGGSPRMAEHCEGERPINLPMHDRQR